MELSLVDYACITFLPSEIAAASLYIAMKADDGSEWTATMEYYSMYSESKLQPCARRIAFLITKTLDGKAKQKVREEQLMITSSSKGTRLILCLNAYSWINHSLARNRNHRKVDGWDKM